MPTRTSPRLSARTASAARPGPSKLRRRRALPPPSPESAYDVEMDDHDSNSDAADENIAALARYAPRHLDEPWAYVFQPNDRVWIRNHEKWIHGRIFPRSVPKLGSHDNLTYYNVLYQDSFGHKLRKYFSPLLGELKPDTSAVRSLLKDAHWI
ncbi:hypothetical protein FB45DRAFT_866728 [Roridomyces roridus]|uniref:Uncharacterized protein n=1 Tax=Roridomyces roridus TaxID=1738132 RepID=A0AAD7B7I1_9AGAR|nr:hypothetical protein FB45DRAFT_1036793 [Roridomyces roridus]KAJ7630180.1 hypothetical protein FB45DRAFT_866728 [Roridomyces roridus]